MISRLLGLWLLGRRYPYDWAIECPELVGAPEVHVRMLWPRTEPPMPPVENPWIELWVR